MSANIRINKAFVWAKNTEAFEYDYFASVFFSPSKEGKKIKLNNVFLIDEVTCDLFR